MPDETHDLSPAEAAAMIGVHPESVRRWAADGLIPFFVTPGGWRRFSRADVETFISSRRTEAAS
jgi:excisionase family DNA binding protein